MNSLGGEGAHRGAEDLQHKLPVGEDRPPEDEADEFPPLVGPEVRFDPAAAAGGACSPEPFWESQVAHGSRHTCEVLPARS